MIVQCRPEMRLEIALDFFQRIPGILAATEDCHVFRLAQIEQIRRFEHLPNLSNSMARRKSSNPGVLPLEAVEDTVPR